MSNQYENKQLFDVRELNPVIVTDGAGYAYGRGTKRGEQIVQPMDILMAALEGSFGVLGNATPGTAIVSQASITTYDATKDVLHITNGETTKDLIIPYIKMFTSVVPGGSGTQKYEILVDTQPGAVSGGSALTARRPNLRASSPLGNISARAGALTTVAAGSNAQRGLYSGELRNGVGLAGDTFLFVFKDPTLNSYLLPATTVGQQRQLAHGPLIVPPGGAARLSHFGASLSTAAQFEWEVGCIVR